MRLRYLDAASSTASTTSPRFSMIKPRHGDNMYPGRLPLTSHTKLQIVFMTPVIFVLPIPVKGSTGAQMLSYWRSFEECCRL